MTTYNLRKMNIYKFEPIVKQTIWGGDKIAQMKHIAHALPQIGESWEISAVAGSVSVVKGTDTTLTQLINEMQDQLVGHNNYERFGNEFPLLIKFIDARKDLSIQVHPNDETAHRQGKKRGKTEMWYALTSDEGAKLYNGLRQQITPEQYKEMIANDTICDALAQYDVHEGDVFYIPAGRIHAIGAGCFVVEIQQTSDVTYRIYDFKRKDKDGNFRELHTQLAAESIDYTVKDDYRTHYEAKVNQENKVVSSNFFTTNIYHLTESMTIDYTTLDSFVVLIATKGEAELEVDEENCTFTAGETVLIPASAKKVNIHGNISFLETYIE